METNNDFTEPHSVPTLVKIKKNDGWQITHNRLFDIEPISAHCITIDTVGFTVWDLYFSQDLMQIKNESHRLLIDIGWYPHADPEGSFRLIMVRLAADQYDWDSPIVDFNTRSLHALITQLHALLC